MLRAACLVAVGCTASTAATGSARVSKPFVTTGELDEVTRARAHAPPPATESAPSTAAPPETAGTTSTAVEEPIHVGMLDGELALEDAWDRWRARNITTFQAAFDIAVLANRARPLAMSDELMVVALSLAVELSGCDPERLGKVRLLAIAVRSADHARELDAELNRLADMGPLECGAR